MPAGTPRKPATPKTPKSGKRSAPVAAFTDESPTKKKKAIFEKSMHKEEDDDEEFSDVRVKTEEVAGILQGAEEYFGECGYGHSGRATYGDDGCGI
jgi:hypothetical protein